MEETDIPTIRHSKCWLACSSLSRNVNTMFDKRISEKTTSDPRDKYKKADFIFSSFL